MNSFFFKSCSQTFCFAHDENVVVVVVVVFVVVIVVTVVKEKERKKKNIFSLREGGKRLMMINKILT